MKKLNTRIFLLLALFSFASCSDWLDIEPDGQATNDKLTETGDGYRTMLSGVYKAMTSANLYGVELQFGLVDCIAQEYDWSWYQISGGSPTAYQNARNFNYSNIDLRDKIDAIWKAGYNVIANTNNLIQNIQNENTDKFADGEMERDMILGEAYACRGLMHFDLCRLFAPAPVENESGNYLPYVDTYPNIQPNSIDVKTYLEKVVADLKKGQELTARFDTTALGMSMNSSANSRFYAQFDSGMEGETAPGQVDDFYKGRGYRLNYYAITALLARVYQYMGQDDLAYECANKVFEFKAKGINGNELSMFTKDDWYTLQLAGENFNTREDIKTVSNLIFALYNEESYEDYNLATLFQKDALENGNPQWFVINLEGQEYFKNSQTKEDEFSEDYRSKYLLFSPDYRIFEGERYRLSGKWYCSENQVLRTKNLQTLPIIRATEMRYIIAEHEARSGNFDKAYEWLEQIRSARGLYTPLTVKRSLEDFLADMIRDAQREWLSEGQLFYLYKRLGAKVKIGSEYRKLNKSEYMLPIPDNQNM